MMRVIQHGDSSFVIEVSRRASSESIALAGRVANFLCSNCTDIATDIAATYASVIVCFPAHRRIEVERWLRQALATARTVTHSDSAPAKAVEIPVCYGGELGPDLQEIARRNHLTDQDLIELHTGAKYTVGAIGFMPGFAYLLGLPRSLHTPRRNEPRSRVAAGSVGIGAMQCGIYPAESPGGWNLIGRTPIRMFNPNGSPAALLGVGMTVQFKPISRREYDRWR